MPLLFFLWYNPSMTNAELQLFRCILQDTFNLRSHVHVRVSKQIRLDREDCYGLYYGEKLSPKRSLHSIRVSKKLHKTPEQYFATLAHEWVHAWQTEHDKELDHDAASGFDMWREYFMDNYSIDLVA